MDYLTLRLFALKGPLQGLRLKLNEQVHEFRPKSYLTLPYPQSITSPLSFNRTIYWTLPRLTGIKG